MIKLVNISKTYTTGKVWVEALKNVNLTFGDNGLSFIVGKSGSGKTTLLNLLGGLDGATSGDVIVNGKKLGAMTGRAADVYRAEVVGFVFQDYNLIEEIGVKGNLELAQMLKGKKAKATDVDDALKAVGLAGSVLGSVMPIARLVRKNPSKLLRRDFIPRLRRARKRGLFISCRL